jgi:hypothetical protein
MEDDDINISQRDDDTYVVGSVDADSDDEHLPVVHDIEQEDGAAAQLERALRELDGPMSVSTALVPMEAFDIGDVAERANPRASDLGYPEGYECAVEYESGRVVLSDAPNWALAGDTYIHADEDDFIEDITAWA